jgi:hypothetical protein
MRLEQDTIGQWRAVPKTQYLQYFFCLMPLLEVSLSQGSIRVKDESGSFVLTANTTLRPRRRRK